MKSSSGHTSKRGQGAAVMSNGRSGPFISTSDRAQNPSIAPFSPIKKGALAGILSSTTSSPCLSTPSALISSYQSNDARGGLRVGQTESSGSASGQPPDTSSSSGLHTGLKLTERQGNSKDAKGDDFQLRLSRLRMPSIAALDQHGQSGAGLTFSSSLDFAYSKPTFRRGRAFDIFQIDAHLAGEEEEFSTGASKQATTARIRSGRSSPGTANNKSISKPDSSGMSMAAAGAPKSPSTGAGLGGLQLSDIFRSSSPALDHQHQQQQQQGSSRRHQGGGGGEEVPEESVLQRRARTMAKINEQRRRTFALNKKALEEQQQQGGGAQKGGRGRRGAVSEGKGPDSRSQRLSTIGGDAYNIRTVGVDDAAAFLQDEGQRRRKVDAARQKKKDLEGLFKTRRKPGSRGSSQQGKRDKSASAAAAAVTASGRDRRASMALIGPDGAVGDTALETIMAQSAEAAQNELEGVMHKYFGAEARSSFQAKFRDAARQLEMYKYDAELPEDLLTPRSLYLRQVTKNKLLPLPLLLRKDSKPTGLHFAYRGLGDERVLPLVTVLEQLPAIQTIDLCDNRLTDATLMPLAAKLPSLLSLTHLDLSFNKMDESSNTIMGYLRDERCQLFTLLLNGADVDDAECKNIAEAMAVNRSVRTLGLSKNLIGSVELLNVLNPDLITGGEALGAMLEVNNTLTKLDLSWNSIRLESAVALALALEKNDTLSTLLLGYNSFGDMPSQILGRTLKKNRGLTVLDIESNSITPKAATVLANAISFNETLLKLNINGNVLGKIGAQALVAAIQRSSSESRALEVSFINCDCAMDDQNVFSAANPHGTWRLNLAEPYGQMVAAECLYLANFKAGCRIIRLLHNGQLVTLERSYVASSEEGEAGAQKKFKLEEFYRNSRIAAQELMNSDDPTLAEASRALNALLVQFDLNMDEEHRLEVLLKTKELWTAKAKREGRDDLNEVFLYEVFFSLFVINDVDFSGTMELDEFLETLASLGKPNFDPDAARRLMLEHDKDESGSIDANEFGLIMLNEFCQTDLPRGDLVDASTGQPWVIPASGHCVIQLSYQCDVPTLFDIGEDYGIDNIIRSIRDAKTDEQREILFQNTTSSPYFFLSFEQAQMLFEEMQGLNRLPLELMSSILPQIVNEEQTNKFLDTNLNDRGKFALRVRIGQLYNSYVGLYTGHYCIDMKAPDQRNGGRRLGAISVTEGKFCKQAGTNSSQKGNNSNFRNEKLGVTPVEVSGRWFASSNSTKTLHCDYVSTTKPRKGTPPMTDARLERVVEQLNLREIRTVWEKLRRKRVHYERRMGLQRQDSMDEDAEESSDDSDLDNCTVNTASSTGSRLTGLFGRRRTGGMGSAGAANPLKRSATEGEFGQDAEAAAAMAGWPFGRNASAGADLAGGGDVDSAFGEHPFGADWGTPAASAQGHRDSTAGRGGDRGMGGTGGASLKQAAVEAPPPAPFTELCPGLVINLEDYPALKPEPPLTAVVLRDQYTEFMDTCHHFYDIYPEERQRDMSRPGYQALEEGARPVTPEEMKLEPCPPRGYLSPIFPLAYKRIVELQIMLPNLFLSVSQLIVLLEYFPPEEGYLRVQLIQSVFSHLVDLEQMHRVIDGMLTQDERTELFHRIGIMNLLDPLTPDRLYRLDLRRYDHREWAKILITLAVAEPGENWEQAEYRWGKYDEPVPGWALPATWTFADDGGDRGGPRAFGWLRLTYRSHGNGCYPLPSLRKFLRKRTLAGMKKIL